VFEVWVSGDDGSALPDRGGHGKGVRIGDWKPGFQLCRFENEIEIVSDKKDRKLKEMAPEPAHILRKVMFGDLIIYFARVDLIHQNDFPTFAGTP